MKTTEQEQRSGVGIDNNSPEVRHVAENGGHKGGNDVDADNREYPGAGDNHDAGNGRFYKSAYSAFPNDFSQFESDAGHLRFLLNGKLMIHFTVFTVQIYLVIEG